jgi:hypothetical protein
MTIATFTSVAANGDIRRVGGAGTIHGAAPEYFTVIELHRHLQDLADDAAAAGDDILDITDNTPSDRSTDNIITMINGFNIDDDLAEYLYDGSIVQTGGAEIYDGIVNFGNAAFIDIVQNGLFLTNDFWNSFSPSGFNSGAGISHRFLVKTRTGGADIDGRRLLGMTHEFNKTYAEFPIAGSARGNNVLALSDADDLNNATAVATVATWTSIVNNNEGYTLIDVTGDAITEPYYSNWDLGTQSKNDFFERMKYLNRRGSTSTVYGLDQTLTPFRGITHQVVVDTPTGTLVEPEQLTWGTGATAGVGQLIAADSTTAATKIWFQLLSGVAPTDGVVITGAGGGTVTVNVTVTQRTVPVPFVGASTGSAIIGAYGFGIESADLTASDLLIDLDATPNPPPNNVTFTVSGLVSAEDYVIVGPRTASALNKAQLGSNALLNGAAVASIVCDSVIPTDTPSAGTIRVVNDSGFEVRVAYSSFTGSTFTLSGTYDFSGVDENDSVTAGNDIWVSYIDSLAGGTLSDAVPRQLSFTVVYNADRDLFVRIRDGGGAAKGSTPIKTFEGNASNLTNTGGSIAAIRTSDL